MQTKSIVKTITGAVVVMTAVFAFSQNAKQSGTPEGFGKYAKQLGLQTTYSADMEMTAMGIPITAKIIQDGDKSRFETTAPVVNIKTVSVTETQNGTTKGFTLYPSISKYVEKTPLTAADGAAAPEMTITDLGTETFNGEKCNKIRVVAKNDEAAKVDILLSPANKNMPVKMTVNMSVPDDSGKANNTQFATITYKNYDFKKPAANLFVIPGDYARAESEDAAMREAMTKDGGGNPFAGLMAMAAAAEAAAKAADDDDEEEDEKPVTRRPATRTPPPPPPKSTSDKVIGDALKGLLR